MSTDVITAGSAAVTALVRRHSFAEVGRQVGCSEAMVRAVASGARRPSAKLRARFAEVFAIPSTDFDAPGPAAVPAASVAIAPLKTLAPVPATVAPPGASSSASPPVELGDAKAVCSSTVLRLQRELARLDGDALATSRERASVASSLTSATRLYARLSGALDVSKSQILRSPHFEAIAGAIVDALEPWPDASVAVARVLRSLEGET